MAERKFDYESVAQVYKSMQNITGDSSNPDSIAGILFSINKEYHEKVDVSEEAIFGDLGKQLLLNWDNTSSSFPNFVDNFGNWSILVSQAAGSYSEFEKRVASVKTNNPLGVTSGGIQTAYTNSNYYSEYTEDKLNAMINAVGPYIPYTNEGYYNTNRVELEAQRKKSAAWAFGINAVSTVLSVWGAGSAISNASKAAGAGVTSLADDAGRLAIGTSDDAARLAIGTSDDIARAAAGSADDFARTVGDKFSIDVSNNLSHIVDETGKYVGSINPLTNQTWFDQAVADQIANNGPKVLQWVDYIKSLNSAGQMSQAAGSTLSTVTNAAANSGASSSLGTYFSSVIGTPGFSQSASGAGLKAVGDLITSDSGKENTTVTSSVYSNY